MIPLSCKTRCFLGISLKDTSRRWCLQYLYHPLARRESRLEKRVSRLERRASRLVRRENDEFSTWFRLVRQIHCAICIRYGIQCNCQPICSTDALKSNLLLSCFLWFSVGTLRWNQNQNYLPRKDGFEVKTSHWVGFAVSAQLPWQL